MAKTVDGLIAHCEQALKQKWQYVYGAKGKVLTRNQIQSLRNIYGASVWESDLNKAGHICCDCSGLISSYTGIERGSWDYRATAVEDYSISKRTKEMRGWAVWLQGHIGVYDGNDGYYAMDGSARNMVHYPIEKNGWTRILKLCDIDYGKGTTPTVETVPTVSGGVYNAQVLPPDSTTKGKKTKGEVEMQCTFQIEGDGTVYWFNGQSIKALTNEDSLKIIQKIYKDNNGKDMPHYKWTKKAPWYLRLYQAINAKNKTFK